MTDQLYLSLHDGARIPQVGLGVWQTPDNEAAPAVKAALDAGYRHVDTAAVYENEQGVGEGIRQSGLPRSDIFLTTKLWNTDQGYEQTLKAFEAIAAESPPGALIEILVHQEIASPAALPDRYRLLTVAIEDGLVPALQDRGLVRKAYEHKQFRENLLAY